MKLSEELQSRGFIHQFTKNPAELLDGEKLVIYHGIDPSADSAHAGNFVVWMLLRHLVNHGHKVIFLVGGGTGLIGDPKPDAERPINDPAEVSIRVDKLMAQAKQVLATDNIEFINNAQWLTSLSLIDFLRDTGKHFTVNDLIKKDAIATRLKSEVGLSYTEFAYPLLQAYDYLNLYRQHQCSLQVGGSDQWGNMVAGVDLIRRVEHASVEVITVPLIVDKTTGKKFGKSEGNAVWLDAGKTTPYQFYQFWLQTSDENVIDYLKLFTLLPLAAIEAINQSKIDNPAERLAQQALAKEVTTLVHGDVTAQQQEKIANCLFGVGEISTLTPSEIAELKVSAPNVDVLEGEDLMSVLVRSGLAPSKREARTLIMAGSITVAGNKVTSAEHRINRFETGVTFLIKRGRRQIMIASVK